MGALNKILSKADKVEENLEEKLNQSDINTCEEYQKQFKEGLEFASGYINNLEENLDPIVEDNKFLDYDIEKLKANMQRKKNKMVKNFINKIIRYFEKTYQITFENSNSFYRGHKENYDVHYKDIAKEVFNQLGGLSFKEKAKQELKEEFLDYRSHYKGKVKNNRVLISNFMNYKIPWKTNDVEIKKYRSEKCVSLLTKILSLFEYDTINAIGEYDYFDNELYNKGDNEDEFIKKHTIDTEKVEGIRLYKNGKITICFKSPKLAREFGREYLKLDT